MKKDPEVTFLIQLVGGLVIALILYFIGSRLGKPFLGNIGWSIIGVSFLINPVYPHGWKWKGEAAEKRVRILGALLIAAAWLIPDNI